MRAPDTPDCEIKGCTRAVYKGFLCRKHYAYVPYSSAYAAMLEVMTATRQAARKHHKRQLAFVRRKIREGWAE